MQDKTPQGQRVKYTGRFATEADTKPQRSMAPARPRAASAGATSAHRPSGFAPAEPVKRRAEPAKHHTEPVKRPAAPKAPAPKPAEKPKREKKTNNKRAAKQGSNWRKLLLPGLLLLVLLIVAFVLIFGDRNKVHHQLPRVERSSDAVFAPDDTYAPEETAAPEVESAFQKEFEEEPIDGVDAVFDDFSEELDGNEFDALVSLNEADFTDDADFFGEDDAASEDDILNELLGNGAGQ